MIQESCIVGVDIGGTHITAAIVERTTGAAITSSLRRSSITASGTAAEIIAAWSTCIGEVTGAKTLKRLCIAMPGPFKYEEGISLMQGQNKYESLFGLNIRELLARSLNISPDLIYFENDAACFLQGELWATPFWHQPHKKTLGITLGTGLGSAICEDGKSYSADKWCHPFNDGIVEDYLCSRWFVQRWKKLADAPLDSVRQLAQLAGQGNEWALQVFEEFGVNLGNFLAEMVAAESIHSVVIGGNIAKAHLHFLPFTEEVVGRLYPTTLITPAILGEQAFLSGAVSSWLYDAEHNNKQIL
ncbi:ROK family protein [Niabella insulamsoli]|uniref:ROK family protein n=1 Tax=Niabella insulamsoli TaxID=3144874 RepID=UPI0031FDBEE7